MNLFAFIRHRREKAARILCAAALLTGVGTEMARAEFDAGDFGALPVQIGGRVQPLDSLARNSLLLLGGKQTVALDKTERTFFTTKPSSWTEADKVAFRAIGLPADDATVIRSLEARPVAAGSAVDADTWLIELVSRPWIAQHLRAFRIDNEEVISLLGLKPGEKNRFRWSEIEAGIPKLAEAAQKAGEKESGARNPFESGTIKLAAAVQRHHMLQHVTLAPGDLPADVEPMREYGAWISALRTASEKLAASSGNGSPGKLDENTERILTSLINRYREFMQEGRVGIVPPRTEDELKDQKWANLGGVLLDVTMGQPLDRPPVVLRYAELVDAYRKGDDVAANTKVKEIAALYPDDVAGHNALKIRGELLFNRTQPFYIGIIVSALAGLAVLIGWITARRSPLTIAYWLVILGFTIQTVGLITRMWIQGRPPVTNLYSSAIFVGWGAALLGLIIERFWRNGVGSIVAATVSFSSLIIAHQLGTTGEDTIEMMRAVLDSNFWLATHVIVITLGYSAMFVAGFLGAAGIIRRICDRGYDAKSEHAIYRSAYGALCFATLASFVGTMLGGIWADQSWGRFWGWDPKENGALLIVIWCAIALHTRIGGLTSKTGFLQLLVFGNVVTAWSWFGTNMLGVGLHSYGFTDAAFTGLVSFCALQMIIIALGWWPVKNRLETQSKDKQAQADA